MMWTMAVARTTPAANVREKKRSVFCLPRRRKGTQKPRLPEKAQRESRSQAETRLGYDTRDWKPAHQ